MTNRIFTAAAAAALLVPALAFAQVEVVNGEAGMIFKDAPSTITRDRVRAESKTSQTAGDAHFKYLGGEAGWAHVSPSHKVVVQNGGLVHASDCPVMASMNVPKTGPAGAGDYGYTGPDLTATAVPSQRPAPSSAPPATPSSPGRPEPLPARADTTLATHGAAPATSVGATTIGP